MPPVVNSQSLKTVEMTVLNANSYQVKVSLSPGIGDRRLVEQSMPGRSPHDHHPVTVR
jgi:hypothetical protein